MAEYTEKCNTCTKANSIPKWGMVWPCNNPVCDYKPISFTEEATTEVSK